jgi:hypothetical protein
MRLGATGLVDPDVDQGDDIKVTETPDAPAGAEPVPGGEYALYDFERGRPLVILALLFVAVVLGFARLRGALSLVGLAASARPTACWYENWPASTATVVVRRTSAWVLASRPDS